MTKSEASQIMLPLNILVDGEAVLALSVIPEKASEKEVLASLHSPSADSSERKRPDLPQLGGGLSFVDEPDP